MTVREAAALWAAVGKAIDLCDRESPVFPWLIEAREILDGAPLVDARRRHHEVRGDVQPH